MAAQIPALTPEERVLAWKRAREQEREAAARVPFCSFDATPELRAGRYSAKIEGNKLTVSVRSWRVK